VTWDEALAVLPVAVSCFIIIIAQSAATARAFATRHGDRVDEDADILGLAAANAAAAISGTFVVNGSLTQTEMADRAGARSQLAQLAAAGAVVLVLLFLTGPLQHLPRAVLGGIVFTIAVGLADVRKLFAFRRESPGEFQLAVTTMAVVALVGVEQGILLAMALSLLRHVRHSYRPHTMVIAHGPDGSLLPVPADPGVQTEPGLVIYRFGADLFYANEARFADEVRSLVAHAPEPVRWLIVDAAAITDIDYSAARMLLDLRAELRRKGVDVAFARVVAPLRADMDRHGITAAVGVERIFPTLHEALAALHGGTMGSEL
jgi:MFS superfamily sulfate permease-like transporter